MFVRWGQTLANIFTTVVDSIGEMIEIGKRMFKTFLNFVNKIFGTNIKDLQDLFNILAFKFAVVFEFMKALISPVQNLLGIIFEIGVILIEKVLNTIFKIGAEFLKISKGGNNIFTVVGGIARLFGDILNFIIEMGSSLVNGFLPHLGPIFDSIKKISDAFQSIFDSIFGSNEAMKGWKSLFEFIGNVVGSTLQATFEVMADIVKGIDSTIKTIKDIINFVQGKEVGKDFGQNAFEALQGLFGLFNPVLAQQMKQLEPKKVQDAIITPEGKVIETAPDDFLIATKTPGRMSKGNVTINIDFKGMQLILQDAGPGEAQRFSETLVEKFREILSRELERQGI
jgi:phage-related protein